MGRGKRIRKKTVSDMSGMMSAISPEELKINSKPIKADARKFSKASSEKEPELMLHDITKPEPTVPGVFRKTSDPFQTMGQSMLGLFGSKTKSDKPIRGISDLGNDIAQLNTSKSSSLKLSLSDGELNTLNDTPNSPEMRPVGEREKSLEGIPPPPLML